MPCQLHFEDTFSFVLQENLPAADCFLSLPWLLLLLL